jgi:hypothetical protein
VNACSIAWRQKPGPGDRDPRPEGANHRAVARSDASVAESIAVSSPDATLPRWVAAILTLLLQSLCSCAQAPGAASIPTPTPTLVPSPSQANLPGETTSAPSPFPGPSPTARPTPQWEKDAFLEADFPWANASTTAFPRRAADAQVKVVNSVFFDDPRFFGFDVQTANGWYHVMGGDHWTVLDGQRVSPTLIRGQRPKDGDSVVVYGAILDRFIIASYVGFPDGTAWYYRSVLGADEPTSGNLPRVYDGLRVWARGVLDSASGTGTFYTLPKQAQFNPQHLGKEALVGGRLRLKDGARVEVTEGIYVQDRGRYVKILASAPSATDDRHEEGVILAIGRATRPLHVQRADGSSLVIDFDVTTRLEFADGSPASAAEHRPGRSIQAVGTPQSADALAAARITVVSAVAVGRSYVAFVVGGSGDLWTVELGADTDVSVRRPVTHLAAPLTGLENAVFSPDGRRFAFARLDGAGSSLVLGDLQSGVLEELLTEDQWQERDPAWSPEGSRLVFTRYRIDGENQVDGGLWVLHWSTGTLARLTPGLAAGGQTVAPRWSPDGRCVAYGQATVDGQQSNLYVLAPPSKSLLVLQHTSEWRWSPDSTQLICTVRSPDETRARLWVVQKDGTSATWLSPKGGNDSRGRVSPDGSAIAFLTRREASDPPDGLGVMRSDGLDRVQPEDQPLASRLAWSPDSKTVVFLRVTASAQAAGLWRVSRDGTGLLQLADDAVALAGTYRDPR